MNKKKNKTNEQQFKELEEQFKDELPDIWDEMSMIAKLDWFGHKLCLNFRKDNKLKPSEDIFMSEYQLERRRRREIQSKIGSWEDIPPHQGIFTRNHVDKNKIIIKKDDNNGQKNP